MNHVIAHNTIYEQLLPHVQYEVFRNHLNEQNLSKVNKDQVLIYFL